MKSKVIMGIVLTLLLITMLKLVFNIQSVKAYRTITSGWLTFPVTFDGKMTTVEEWSDTIPVDITLFEWHGGPGTVSARVWMKNDDAWLYMLYRAEWPAGDTDPLDAGYIDHFWDWLGCPPSPCWNHSDIGGVVQFDNTTFDYYGWDETRWYNDTDASPPGENNVEGAATHDGTYYWFEFRKELDSGDGNDWAFTPGQIIETTLLVGVWDESTGTAYEDYISLHLSLFHDVAVIHVVSLYPEVDQGQVDPIYVAIENQGDSPETVDVYAFYDGNLVAPKQTIPLNPGQNITLIFNWNTTGVPLGTYTISANATIPVDDDPTDNIRVAVDTQEVIPEFPPAIILPLFMILSLITVVFVKHKKKKQ